MPHDPSDLVRASLEIPVPTTLPQEPLGRARGAA
jgi:hypothetical protein